MRLVQLPNRIRRTERQQIEMLGVNLTDRYTAGEMESCNNITSDSYPYISTAKQLQNVDTGIPDEYQPVSMYAWEKLFVVSNEPHEGGYKCYYGGNYIGDVHNLEPKQYAVVNSKLVLWPDKVYFELYDQSSQAVEMDTAPTLAHITSGTVVYRKAVQ